MCGTTYCTDCEEFTVPEENGCCPYCEKVLDRELAAQWEDRDATEFWTGFEDAGDRWHPWASIAR